MTKYIGLSLFMVTSIGLTILLFNNAFQFFEYLVKYHLLAGALLIVCMFIAIAYTFLEFTDGNGW